MSKKLTYCGACEIEFKVKHDADDAYYAVAYCPFCGADVEAEEPFRDDSDED